MPGSDADTYNKCNFIDGIIALYYPLRNIPSILKQSFFEVSSRYSLRK